MNKAREWYRITHLSERIALGLCDSVEVEPVEAINWNPDTMPRPKVLREVWWRIALGAPLSEAPLNIARHIGHVDGFDNGILLEAAAIYPQRSYAIAAAYAEHARRRMEESWEKARLAVARLNTAILNIPNVCLRCGKLCRSLPRHVRRHHRRAL